MTAVGFRRVAATTGVSLAVWLAFMIPIYLWYSRNYKGGKGSTGSFLGDAVVFHLIAGFFIAVMVALPIAALGFAAFDFFSKLRHRSAKMVQREDS